MINNRLISIIIFILFNIVFTFNVQSEEITIYSNSDTVELFDGNEWIDSVETWVHGDWTSINNAKWIWSSKYVQKPNLGETYNFRSKFKIPYNANIDEIKALLYIAVDDVSIIKINNNQMPSSIGGFKIVKTIDLKKYIKFGDNYITFDVTNSKIPTTDPKGNPAGFIFKLCINFDTKQDDYPNICYDAHLIELNQIINAKIDYPGQNGEDGDCDYYKIEVPEKMDVSIFTTGDTDTYGILFDDCCNKILSDCLIKGDNNSGEGANFRIYVNLTQGVYYLKVRHNDNMKGTGDYSLHVQKVWSMINFSNTILLQKPQSNRDGIVKFIWNPLNNYSKYNIHISESSDFSVNLVNRDIHSDNFIYISDLDTATKYYVRVRGCNNDAETQWSNIQICEPGKIVIENETTKYTQGNPFFILDPINSATGSYSYSGLDISFSSVFPFQFHTIYNTFSTNSSPLGVKWNHSYNVRLTFNNFVSIHWPDGSRHDYEVLPDNEQIYIRQGIYNGDNLFKDNSDNYVLLRKNFMKYIFNNLGLLIYIVDKNGNTIYLDYNEQNLLKKVSPNGATGYFNFNYDDKNRLIEVYDHTARMIQYKYDQNNDLITYIDTLENEKVFIYDNKHLMKNAIDQNGNTFISNEYDELNRVISQADARGYTVYLSYDTKTEPGKTITTQTDPEGNVKIFKHIIANSNLIEYIDPLGSITKKNYDAFNNLLSITDPMGYTTYFEYDGNNNLISSTDAMGYSVSYKYDANNNLIQQIDENGNSIYYNYDGYNNLSSMTNSDGNSVTYLYNNRGKLVSQINALGHSTEFDYDDNNNLICVTDENNNKTFYSYDNLGRRISQKDAVENITSFEYDDKNRLVKTVYPNGGYISKEYDRLDNVIKEINIQGYATQYVYDPNYNIIQIIDTMDNITKYEYNKLDKEICRINPLGFKTHYTYNPNGKLITEKNSLGHVTIHEYDKNGRLSKLVNARGHSTIFNYDALGKIIKIIEPMSKITNNTYDSKGNLISVENSKGSTTHYEYDSMNRLIKTKDELGNEIVNSYNSIGKIHTIVNSNSYTMSYIYDAKGQLVKTIDALNNTIINSYDSCGNLIAITEANGNTTTYRYDTMNRLIEEIDTYGNITEKEYDLSGRLIEIKDAQNNSTKFTYDALDRLILTTDAVGNTTKNFYDSLGRVIKVRDEENNDYDLEYDSLGNVIKKIDSLNNITKYYYDEMNNLTKMIDSLGNTVIYKYDQLNRHISTIDFNKNVTEMIYDTAGNPIILTNTKGFPTYYEYDKLNRLISETDSLGNVIQQTYNNNGLVESTINARNQKISFKYDSTGNLIQQIFPDYTLINKYDKNGNLLRVLGKEGREIKYTYDLLNRISSRTDEFGKTIKYEYTNVGNISKVIYSDGRSVDYTYDDLNRMESVTDWNYNQTVYNYSPSGNLIKITLPDNSELFRSYDKANRLTELKAIASTGQILYRYLYSLNAIGNKVKVSVSLPFIKSISPISHNYQYNEENQLISKDGKNLFEYDNDGNLISKNDNIHSTILSFDEINQLISYGNNYYTYDSENNRIQKKVNDKTIRYVYDINWALNHILEETDENGEIKVRYVYGLGLISREDISENYRVYHFNSNGSTILLTNKDGEITDKYSYGAFGKITMKRGNTDNPFLYNGRDGVIDDSNGLYFMSNRYYDLENKMFITKDLLEGVMNNPNSFNKYAFVNGNPINMIDPLGLSGNIDNDFYSNINDKCLYSKVCFDNVLNAATAVYGFSTSDIYKLQSYIDKKKVKITDRSKVKILDRMEKRRIKRMFERDMKEEKKATRMKRSSLKKTKKKYKNPSIAKNKYDNAMKKFNKTIKNKPKTIMSYTKNTKKVFNKSKALGIGGKLTFANTINGIINIENARQNGSLDAKTYASEYAYLTAGLTGSAGGPLAAFDAGALAGNLVTGGAFPEDSHKKLIHAAVSSEAADKMAEDGLKRLEESGTSSRCVYDPESCGMDWYGGFVISIGSSLGFGEW